MSDLDEAESVTPEIHRLKADSARLRIALEALLSVRNDIEVLGEWEEADINRGLRRTVRAKVDAVVAQARAALRGEG